MAVDIDRPLVSVVIVNYNGADFIGACLRSVFAASGADTEVILVDNASTDGALESVRRDFRDERRLKIAESPRNEGPVRARNRGIADSRGEYIAFLDNDTQVEAGWLRELVAVLKADAVIGAAQSKILLSDRKTIDTCGHFLSITGFPYEIGSGSVDSGQYDSQRDIFGARSAAMIVRREALERAGSFDEDYFIYSEETDLSWRIWLAGYRVVYVPRSVVFHHKGGSLNERSRHLVFYEGAKNCTKTLIKNLGLQRLLVMLPLHIASWLLLAAACIVRGRFRDAWAVIAGLAWDAGHAGRILRDRRAVQKKRAVPDNRIMPVIMGTQSAAGLFKKGIAWLGRV